MSVRVTNKDLVLLGHGSYSGGAEHTRLPENVDFYLLPPVGYTLKTDVAEALIAQEEITQLMLHHDNGRGDTLIEVPTAVYKAGELAPNLTLYNLGSLTEWGRRAIGDKQNVVTVDQATKLSELIASNEKIQQALKDLPEGETLKLYWSACAAQVSGNSAELPTVAVTDES